MAMLVVRRRSQYNAAIRALDVLLDGQKIGEVRNGKREEFTVPEGAHILEFKMDFKTSEPNELVFRDGDQKTVEVGMCNAFMALPAVLGMVKYITVTVE